MELGFSGYGGNYCVGKLTETEVTNIIELLARFDDRFFLSSVNTVFDTHDFKREYYDFDDVYQFESVALTASITIDSLPEDYKSNLTDAFTTDDINVIIGEEKNLADGYYLTSAYEVKGNFFSVKMDINPDDFDPSLLSVYCSDMDNFSMSDVIITEVKYDGVLLEMDTDSYYVDGQGFSQSILYVEDGKHYDGLEKLRGKIEKQYPIINELPSTIDKFPPDTVITQYLEFVEAKNDGYLLNKDYILAYASPMLYDNFDKEEIDAMWMTEENIKYVLRHNLLDSMPEDVYDRIVGRFPEWLI